MRAKIHLQIDIAYSEPARAITQVFRLKPRSFESQHVLEWRLGVSPDALLRRTEDSFGNVVQTYSNDGPLDKISIVSEGEVEINDAAGVLRGSIEKFPLDVFRRDTDLTLVDAAMIDFAQDAVKADKDELGRMHALMAALHKHCAFRPDESEAPRSAIETFKAGAGSARELAQVFVAAARSLGFPARFVSGLFLGAEIPGEARGHHAWADVYVDDIGWISFDSALDYCPRDEHLRLGKGLDYYGAAPRRGAKRGYAAEKVTTRLTVEPVAVAQWQIQG